MIKSLIDILIYLIYYVTYSLLPSNMHLKAYPGPTKCSPKRLYNTPVLIYLPYFLFLIPTCIEPSDLGLLFHMGILPSYVNKIMQIQLEHKTSQGNVELKSKLLQMDCDNLILKNATVSMFLVAEYSI